MWAARRAVQGVGAGRMPVPTPACPQAVRHDGDPRGAGLHTAPRGVAAVTQDDALYRFRLRVLALAEELGNVRAA